TGRRGKYLSLPVVERTLSARAAAADALLAPLGTWAQLLLGAPAAPVSPHVAGRSTTPASGPELRVTAQRPCARPAFRGARRVRRSAPRPTACTSTSTGKAGTSAGHWRSMAVRASRARAAGRPSAGIRS